MHQTYPKGLLKHTHTRTYRLLAFISRVSDSLGLGYGLRICTPNKFPSDTDAAGLGTTLRELLDYREQVWQLELFFRSNKYGYLKKNQIENSFLLNSSPNSLLALLKMEKLEGICCASHFIAAT